MLASPGDTGMTRIVKDHAERCPRCLALLGRDEDGAACWMCGYRPRPAELLDIPTGVHAARTPRAPN